jgi:hypothetical protein
MIKNSVARADSNALSPSVELIVSAENFEPAEITAALSLRPTQAGMRGEQIRPDHTPKAQLSTWILRSPRDSDQTLADQLAWLLDLLEPKRDIVQNLADRYSVEIWCRF